MTHPDAQGPSAGPGAEPARPPDVPRRVEPVPTVGGSGRGARRTAAVLLGGAALLIAVWWIVGRLLGTHTSGVENRLMRHLEQARGTAVEHIAEAASTFGSARVLLPLVAVVAIIAALRARLAVAVVLAVSTLGGLVLSDSVKLLVARARPPLPHRLVSVAGWSFPSGHATQSAAILPALALAAVAFGVPRVLAMTLAVIGVLGVGLSRIMLGVHYPTDVLAGWLLGGTWFLLTTAVIRTDGPDPGRPSAPDGEGST
jgi:membrane-associated phospholipid phosphatase